MTSEQALRERWDQLYRETQLEDLRWHSPEPDSILLVRFGAYYRTLYPRQQSPRLPRQE